MTEDKPGAELPGTDTDFKAAYDGFAAAREKFLEAENTARQLRDTAREEADRLIEEAKAKAREASKAYDLAKRRAKIATLVAELRDRVRTAVCITLASELPGKDGSELGLTLFRQDMEPGKFGEVVRLILASVKVAPEIKPHEATHAPAQPPGQLPG